MKVMLALLATRASILVAGKRLVSGEGLYKDREILWSSFFFITHCFWQFTKITCPRADGKIKICLAASDDCGLVRRSKI